MEFANPFTDIISGFSSVTSWISGIFDGIGSIFSDIGFDVLYNWLPADIVSVLTSVFTVLLFLALFGLIRQLLFFLG